jgi:3-oxoacyl-[acyl-carrier-protein] synthase II
MGRVALMAVTSADAAMKAAGIMDESILRSGRCGVSYGSSTGSVNALLDFYSMLTTNKVAGGAEELNPTESATPVFQERKSAM